MYHVDLDFSTDISEFQQGENIENSHVDIDFSRDMPTNIVNMMGIRCFFQIFLISFINPCLYVLILKCMFKMLVSLCFIS